MTYCDTEDRMERDRRRLRESLKMDDNEMDEDWLCRYAMRFYGELYASLEDNELSELLTGEEWRRLRAAWRKHKQRQKQTQEQAVEEASEEADWAFAVREFRALCRDADISPADALHVVAAYVELDDGAELKQEVEAYNRTHAERS